MTVTIKPKKSAVIVSVDSEFEQKLKQLYLAEGRIPCIKLIMKETGAGLREAYEAIYGRTVEWDFERMAEIRKQLEVNK
jgi:hypothetical protein